MTSPKLNYNFQMSWSNDMLFEVKLNEVMDLAIKPRHPIYLDVDLNDTNFVRNVHENSPVKIFTTF